MPEGGEELITLGRRLREAGTEGRGLRSALLAKIDEAVQPLTDEIGSLEHLIPYFPDRYASVLAGDLNVTVRRTLAGDPKITIRAQARDHKRKIRLFNDFGYINHPVYARGPNRRKWAWVNGQEKGMRRGFFDDAALKHAPEIRDKGAEALRETNRMLAGG